ncbi:MAG: DoxX family membrane protein [Cellvibrionaceae bacterium]
MKAFLGGKERQLDAIAMVLRIGLGLVFVIGGWNKLYQLLDPASSDAILASYLGTTGYINQFFTEYLFSGALGHVMTPWGFLTTLSAFELISGCMLVVGFIVRPLSIIWALLLWSFIVSLPVVTTPGVTPTEATYTAPALFVQVRDVALSGLFFLLYNVGSGRFSVDERLNTGRPVYRDNIATRWNELGLLLRVSLALPFLVAGFFHGLDNIQTFKLPAIVSVVLGLTILIGFQVRFFAAALAIAMLYFILQKINIDKSLIANLNGFKRECGFLAASIILFHAGGGKYYTLDFDWLAKRFSNANV